VTDVNDKEGKSVVAQIHEEGGEAEYWHMDTANEERVEEVFQMWPASSVP